MVEPLLSAKKVSVRFDTRNGPIHAVRGIDLDVGAGETLAIVGESGSGKSAFAKAILRQHQPPFTRRRSHVSGEIWFRREQVSVDLIGCDAAMLRSVRAHDIAMVFQEAMSGLNPVKRIGEQVAEAALCREPGLSRHALAGRVIELLDRIGIPEPERRVRGFPHELSGGQRQRVMIAIAAVRSPRLLIADEPTTALDVTVQARLLALLKSLQNGSRMSMLFITHDLGVVAQLSDRVAVMYAGHIVEFAETKSLFGSPRHPYAAGLLASLPGSEARGEKLKGHAPEPDNVPEGCAFRPRCPRASEVCKAAPPAKPSSSGWVKCWHPLS